MRLRPFAAAALLLAGMTPARALPPVPITSADAPAPLLEPGKPVDWLFVFKFNTASFPGCGGNDQRVCLFDTAGTPKDYKFGQQFVYASAANPALQKGSGCAGDTPRDPLGATFGQVYNGNPFYVVWNDQFYGNPPVDGGSTWGHSKGMLAWNAAGEGVVLQVSTPSWPASGSKANPRVGDGNTLGCVTDDDVEVSQHFFALRLSKTDLPVVLRAMQNASVVTDPKIPQIVRNGGPVEIQALVNGLGKLSASKKATTAVLSSGVTLVSKPSDLIVPPWQLVSALLGGPKLRAATWIEGKNLIIHSTGPATKVGCWAADLPKPGPVELALSGSWMGQHIGLTGGAKPDGNHAKIGVDEPATRAIFGDMNQEGSLSGPKCNSAQNQRGGMFFVVPDPVLAKSVDKLIEGASDPVP